MTVFVHLIRRATPPPAPCVLPFLRLADSFGRYGREVTYSVHETITYPPWAEIVPGAAHTYQNWRLNERPRPPTPDYTLYQNVAENAINGTYTPTGVLWQVPGSTADGDTAITLVGGSAHIPAPDAAGLGSFSGFPLALLIHVRGTSAAGGTLVLIGQPGTPVLPFLGLGLTPAGYPQAILWTGQPLIGPTALTDGAWHQLLLRPRLYTTPTTTLFQVALVVDGVQGDWLTLDPTIPPPDYTNGAYDLWLGTAGGADPWAGSLDELVLTTATLSDAAVAELYGSWQQLIAPQVGRYWVSPAHSLEAYQWPPYPGAYWTQEEPTRGADGNYYTDRSGATWLYGALPDYATIFADPPPTPGPTDYSVAAGRFTPGDGSVVPGWTVPHQLARPPATPETLSLGQGIRWGGVQSVAPDATGAGMYVIPTNTLSIRSYWNPVLHWDGSAAQATTEEYPLYYNWARAVAGSGNPYAVTTLDACFTFHPGSGGNPGYWSGFADDSTQTVRGQTPPYLALPHGLRTIWRHGGALFGLADGVYAPRLSGSGSLIITGCTAVLQATGDPLHPENWPLVRLTAPENLLSVRGGAPWAGTNSYSAKAGRRTARLAFLGSDVFWTTELTVDATTGAAPVDSTCVWRMSGAGHTISASFALPAPAAGLTLASGGLVLLAGTLYFWTWEEASDGSHSGQALRLYQWGGSAWTLRATDTTAAHFAVGAGGGIRSVIGTQGTLIWLWSERAGTPTILRYAPATDQWQACPLTENGSSAYGTTIFFVGAPP